MYILLPPSEGKSAPEDGPGLDIGSLPYPELNQARRRVAEALITVSRSDNAAAILGVGARTMSEVVAQRDLYSLPCAPAREIYTGVLYEAARLRPGDRVLIFSGMFGVTSGEDLIPAYRLSMNVSLPDIGGLKTFWKREFAGWRPSSDSGVSDQRNGEIGGLPGSGAAAQRADVIAALAGRDTGSDTQTNAMAVDGEAVVDMRSQAYAVTSHPDVPWWMLRVTNANGKVVSHMAKRYRGLLTRALLDEMAHDTTHEPDVAEVARGLGKVSVETRGLHNVLTLTPELL